MGKDRNERQNRTTNRRPLRRPSAVADWGAVDAAALRDTISAAGASGGAVRFGYTRDGGAYAIGIYGLGDPYTEYVRPGDDIEGFLSDLAEVFRDQPPSGAATAARDVDTPAP